MSDVTHTPGPWTLTNSREVFSKASGDPICVVSWGFTPLDRQVAKADARLLAAAPELLAALKEIRRIAADIPAIERNPRFADASRDALAAIAKAEGRS